MATAAARSLTGTGSEWPEWPREQAAAREDEQQCQPTQNMVQALASSSCVHSGACATKRQCGENRTDDSAVHPAVTPIAVSLGAVLAPFVACAGLCLLPCPVLVAQLTGTVSIGLAS
jgi:hypothetical protein